MSGKKKKKNRGGGTNTGEVLTTQSSVIGRSQSEKSKDSELILMSGPEKKVALEDGKVGAQMAIPESTGVIGEKKEVKIEVEAEADATPITLGDLTKDISAKHLNLGRLFLSLAVVFLVFLFLSERTGLLGSVDISFISFWPLLLIFVGFLLFKVKTSKTKLFGSLLVVLVFVFAVGTLFKGENVVSVVQSGEELEEVREIEAFTELTLESVADISYVEGEETYIKLTGDASVLREVTTEVSNGTLRIGYAHSFWALFLFDESKVSIEIVNPSLEHVSLLGVGTITAQGVSGEEVSVMNIGEGEVIVNGELLSSTIVAEEPVIEEDEEDDAV